MVNMSLILMFVCVYQECSWSQCEPGPRVQGGGYPEVPFHPPSLWRVQGGLGLADLVGHLLRSRHCSL